MQFCKLGLICLLTMFSMSARAVETSVHALSGGSLDTNTGLAERSVDTVYNVIADFELSHVMRIEPNFNRAYLLTSGFQAQSFSNVSMLSHVSLNLEGKMLWQNRFGYTDPFYSGSLKFQYSRPQDSNRHQTSTEAQLMMHKRLNDRISVTLGGRARTTDSKWGIEDGISNRLFVAGDLNNRNKNTWYGTLGITQGTVFSVLQTSYCDNSPAPGLWYVIMDASLIKFDEAYNDSFCGQWFAYRLQGYGGDITLGLNRPVARGTSMDLSWVAAKTYADAGVEYQRQLVRAALLWQW